MQKYEVGDIVFVSDVNNPNEEGANYHFFVIIDEDQSIVDANLFGFLVSSNSDKEKGKSKYQYNEPLKKTKDNGLKVDSHVKCDKLYSFSKWCIVSKIGTVDVQDFIRFITAYNNYLKNTQN